MFFVVVFSLFLMMGEGRNHLGNCIVSVFSCCYCGCVCSETFGCLKLYGVAEITPSRQSGHLSIRFCYSVELISFKQYLLFLVNNKPREALSLRQDSQLCIHSPDSHGGGRGKM